MEVGSCVWAFDSKGTDVDFPDDPEACGVWRAARVVATEFGAGR